MDESTSTDKSATAGSETLGMELTFEELEERIAPGISVNHKFHFGEENQS